MKYQRHLKWFGRLERRGITNLLSDKAYLKLAYKFTMGKPLNLKNPVTFNEKLQWLKLYNRKPIYTVMVDKYKVREYIAEKLGEEYLIPLVGVWDSVEEIDFDGLPERFVMKCNHNSGKGMYICKDKSQMDVAKVKKELKAGLKENYYMHGREWPYKDVPRKIIAEQYMVDGETKELRDYKFFCFDGRVDCVMVCIDRSIGEPKFYFFDREWKLLRYNKRGKAAAEDFTLPAPTNIAEMFDIAEKLSAGLPYSRIDLYSVEGKTYFGEITFFPDSGLDTNILEEMDIYWGEQLRLPLEE